MPKRSERDTYKDSFGRNPYKGVSAKEMYSRLRWGNRPEKSWAIEGPEDMATIGELAKLTSSTGILCEFEEGDGPFIAIGRDTNLIYIVPKESDNSPINIPYVGYREICLVRQIDYFSDKAGEISYYYHKHEKPYPILAQHKSGVCIIMPSNNKGQRSYVVDDAGIIG